MLTLDHKYRARLSRDKSQNKDIHSLMKQNVSTVSKTICRNPIKAGENIVSAGVTYNIKSEIKDKQVSSKE